MSRRRTYRPDCRRDTTCFHISDALPICARPVRCTTRHGSRLTLKRQQKMSVPDFARQALTPVQPSSRPQPSESRKPHDRRPAALFDDPPDSGSEKVGVVGVADVHAVVDDEAVTVVTNLDFVAELDRFPEPTFGDWSG